MKLLNKTHKVVIISFVLATLLAATLLIIDYKKNENEVLSVTQDITVTAEVPHIITVKVKPESRIPPVGNDSLPLTIEIRPESSLIAIKTINVTATSTGDAELGAISLAEIPEGTYDVAIKGLSHLRQVFPSQTFSGPSIRTYSLTSPELAAGDANPTSDNYVNGLDISYITMNIYSNDLRADLTHDGIINSLDYAALIKNVYSHGDE